MKTAIRNLLLGVAIVSFCCIRSAASAQAADTWNVDINLHVGNSWFFVGSGYITFFDDSTLTGYFIIRPPRLGSNAAPKTFNMGFFLINGTWVTNSSNQRIGIFQGSSNAACGPTVELAGNSFTATLKTTKTGPTLSMNAETNNGPMQFKGIPPVVVTDFDFTSWTSKFVVGKDKFTEFFLLTSIPGLPDLYDLEGEGSNYLLTGRVLFSAGNKVALEIVEVDTGTVLATRYLRGNFNPKKHTVSLEGKDNNQKSATMTATEGIGPPTPFSPSTCTPDFGLSVAPGSQTVVHGNSTTYTLNVTALNFFDGPVDLSADPSSVPFGVNVSFKPSSVTGSGSSTMTVNVGSGTTPGTYTLTIIGTDVTDSLTHTTTFTLVVT